MSNPTSFDYRGMTYTVAELIASEKLSPSAAGPDAILLKVYLNALRDALSKIKAHLTALGRDTSDVTFPDALSWPED